MNSDSFHRLAKVLVDSGEVETVADALEVFMQLGVKITLGPNVSWDIGTQIIALTAINAAARSFQGNIELSADLDMLLIAPGFTGRTLREFLSWLDVKETLPTSINTKEWPTIAIGFIDGDLDGAILPWADGWRFGIGVNDQAKTSFAPACVAAGGLAVSEAFSILRKDNPYSGRRQIALSLWNPTTGETPIDQTMSNHVPSTWIVGLGHLGQAYAWVLGFMQPREKATLFLQDIDIVTQSSISTSVLSFRKDLGAKKTRVIAAWLEARGYQTSLVERRFDENQRVGMGEPRIALFGVDNAAARRVIEGAGFRLAIDAGLGAGYRDFRAIRLRTFPGPSRAKDIWANPEAMQNNVALAPAYKALLAQGAEPCGVTMLATRAVGAPFVGCVAAAYALASLIKGSIEQPLYGYLDLNLRDPQRIDCGS